MAKTALIAGATGLVGGHLVRRLVADPTYEQVISIGRRWLPWSDLKLKQIAVDFRSLQSVPSRLHVDDVFCALGTTVSQARSRAAYREIDFDAVLNVGRLGLALGAQTMSIVSSLGANPRSRFFYPRLKGETEEALAGLGYRTLHVYRPSLLARGRRQRRWLEPATYLLLKALRPFLVRRWSALQPSDPERLAEAMRSNAGQSAPGVIIHGPQEFAEL